ncbi:MAG: ABC transporter ATP-binding protein [Candidatus Methanomethylicia archaeon]
MDCIVLLDKVSKHYNGFKALDDVSLSVKRSETYVVLGPNGAGKTTLFNIIAGVLKPSSGCVKVFGVDPSDPKIHYKISYLPSTSILYPWLTSMENIEYYALIYGLGKDVLNERSSELFDYFGVNDLKFKLASKLSTGQSKLISIIITLIVEPELIILDEPTTGLDPNMRKKVLDLIRKLSLENVTIMFATHIVNEAEELMGRVAIMDGGKIIVEGNVEELKKSYAPPSVITIKTFEEYIDKANAILKQYCGNNVYIINDELRIHTNDPDRDMPKYILKLSEMGLKVSSVKIDNPTLEDVFLRLTGRGLKK